MTASALHLPDGFVHSHVTDLRIPGLGRDYVLLHLSDAHLSAAGEDAPAQEKKYAEERNAYWSREYGTSPADALAGLMEQAKTVRPDAVILTGDAVDYCSEANIAAVRSLLAASPCPVLYVRGNHEGLPEYGHLYGGLMGSDPGFQVMDLDGLTLVGMDDAWNKEVSPEHLERLMEYDRRGTPILLCIHVPLWTPSLAPEVHRAWGKLETGFLIGLDGGIDRGNSVNDRDSGNDRGGENDHDGGNDHGGEGYRDSETALRFWQFVTRESKNIRAVLAGHVHFAHRGEFADGKLQLVAAPAYAGYCGLVKISGK